MLMTHHHDATTYTCTCARGLHLPRQVSPDVVRATCFLQAEIQTTTGTEITQAELKRNARPLMGWNDKKILRETLSTYAAPVYQYSSTAAQYQNT